MGMTVEELVARWGFDVDPSGELGKMKQSVTSIRNGFAKLGAVAGAALAAVIMPAANLEQALADTMTMTGATGAEFDRLKKGMTKKARELAEELGISSVDINKAFYQTLSAGTIPLSDDFNALSATALKMAKTVGMDASNAIEDLNTVLKASNKPLTDAGQVADVLFRSSMLAATNVPQLVEAMKNAAPVAVNFGMSIEETAALLDALADRGFKGGRPETDCVGFYCG